MLKNLAIFFMGYYIAKNSMPKVIRETEALIKTNQDVLAQLQGMGYRI